MRSSQSGDYEPTTNNYDATIWGDKDNGDDEDHDDEKAAQPPLRHRIYVRFAPIIKFYRPLGELHSFPEEFTGRATLTIPTILYRLRGLSTLCAVLSAIFWTWAMYNTKHMSKGRDLGIYSFMTTLISSHWALWRTLHGQLAGRFIATIPFRVAVTSSHVLVTGNYFLGLLYSLTVGSTVYYKFGLYCLIFGILWGACAATGWWLLFQLHKIESSGNNRGVEEEDPFGLDQGGDYF